MRKKGVWRVVDEISTVEIDRYGHLHKMQPKSYETVKQAITVDNIETRSSLQDAVFMEKMRSSDNASAIRSDS